jgi:hypothetical protein
MKEALRGLAAAAVLLGAACGTEKRLPTEMDDAPSPDATFTRVQAEVFTPQCAIAGCHGGPASVAQEGMPLGEGLSYEAIVGVRSTQMDSLLRVEPFDPANSYLVRKITPGSLIAGSPMPFGGFLTDDERRLVRDWVARGAPKD